ncbi:helix-turn-helix domain-containing protein [Erysipelotrichaceae bacterium 66202529]|nr:helix-turn-helix domain-containing protein [Erysipelotrichaceae bacterium 66202529]
MVGEHMKNDIVSQIIDLCLEMTDFKTAELADLIGVKPRQINRWRNGTTSPDILTFLRFCKLLKVDVNKICEILAEPSTEIILHNKQEVALLKYYRHASKEEQEKIDIIINALSK